MAVEEIAVLTWYSAKTQSWILVLRWETVMKVIQNLAQVAHFFSPLNFIFILILRRKNAQCTSIFFILLYVYLLSLADESAEV